MNDEILKAVREVTKTHEKTFLKLRISELEDEIKRLKRELDEASIVIKRLVEERKVKNDT